MDTGVDAREVQRVEIAFIGKRAMRPLKLVPVVD
jgi:hypothetical protein